MRIYPSSQMINIEQNPSGNNGSFPKGTLSIDIEGTKMRFYSSFLNDYITDYLPLAQIQDATGTAYGTEVNAVRDTLNAFFF